MREAREHVSAGASLPFLRPPDCARDSQRVSNRLERPRCSTTRTVFEGHLYIAGPAGLTKYDGASGAIARALSVGRGAAASAADRRSPSASAGDSQAPELWIGTWGEGLAAFDGRAFRQIRADDARLRKITAILPVDTGRILIGTEKAGVLVYDGHRSHRFIPPSPMCR